MLITIIVMEDLINKKRIFVMDSGKSYLDSILSSNNFLVKCQSSRQSFISQIKDFKANLIIGDFFCEDQEDLISTLRDDHSLHNIPVILCSDNQDITEMIKKINGNVNDYLVRPFDKEEAVARINRVLDRHEKVLNSNPLSHLPGNILINSHVTNLAEKKEQFALLYLDLDNFKSYNDFYSYSKGDEVIQVVADICRNSLNQYDLHNGINFVGHVGGDDFIIVRSADEIEKYCIDLINEFDHKITSFYSENDQKNGFITTFDRKGIIKKFPIMSLSVSVVINDKGEDTHFGELSLRGAQIKKYLKSLSGSNFLIDRRKVEFSMKSIEEHILAS